MKLRPALALATAATFIAGSGFVVPASASAASCSVRVGPNLAVDAPFEEFGASLAPDCSSGVDYASWDLVHATTGYSGGVSFEIDEGQTTDSFDFYSYFDELGSYRMRPSFAYGDDGSVSQNTVAVLIKAQSGMDFSARRSGSVVTLSVGARYYNVGQEEYRPWNQARVAMQTRSSSSAAWKTVKTVTTSSVGKVTYGIGAANRAEFRAVVQPTTKIWGRTSATYVG